MPPKRSGGGTSAAIEGEVAEALNKAAQRAKRIAELDAAGLPDPEEQEVDEGDHEDKTRHGGHA